MKQCLKFQLILIGFVAFFLFAALPIQSQPKTTEDIVQKLTDYEESIKDCEESIKDCEEKLNEIEEKLDRARKLWVPAKDSGLFELEEKWREYYFKCADFSGKLKKLKEELDKLASSSTNVVIPEEERKKIENSQAKLDELKDRNDNLQKRRKELEARIKKLKEAARNSAVSELASKINKVLKPELEKEFGPLKDQIMYDKKEMWGRVISIDYQLPEGKRLDDTWGHKAVKALGRLGITAMYEGNEVRADQQKIAGKEASSIQLTTQRTLKEPDVIAITAMFLRNR